MGRRKVHLTAELLARMAEADPEGFAQLCMDVADRNVMEVIWPDLTASATLEELPAAPDQGYTRGGAGGKGKSA